ncbi:MAG: hypothetical protein AAF915_14865 [Cyanobacteria bacterium P01_D01_bin.50]
MNQHREHLELNLASQKLTISEVSFASIRAFVNTPNQKCSTLFMGGAEIGNTEFLSVFLQKLSHLVLSDSITFVMIFARRAARKIARVRCRIKEVELWVIKACKLRLTEIIKLEKMKAVYKRAFFDRYAVSRNNLSCQETNVFNKEDKVQIKLALLEDWDCECMGGKVFSM